jgi:hypothetical protein
MFQALEPFRKDVVVDEPIKGSASAVKKFFSCYKKYQHKEPLKGLGVQSMTIEEFWEDNDKIIVDHKEVTQVVLSCMCMWLAIYRRLYL